MDIHLKLLQDSQFKQVKNVHTIKKKIPAKYSDAEVGFPYSTSYIINLYPSTAVSLIE